MGKPRAGAGSGANLPLDLASLGLAITEHAPVPMAAVEGAGHIVRYVNPAFCRLMDRAKEELVGKRFRDVLPDNDPCLKLLDRVYRTGRPESHTERQESRAHPVFWSYVVWPVIVKERPAGVMVQVTETAQFHEETVAMNEALILGSLRQHELTEAADASNADLSASDAAKNHFIAVLSHELRSPLSVIVLWSQLLQRSGSNDDNLRKGLEVIDRSSKALAQLIEDLLDVHRITSGKLRLEPAEVDLAEITRSVVDSMTPAAMEKGIRIEMEIDTAPAVVSGDPARLQQVLGNVLGNAVKFTPKGGEIRVSLRRKGARAELRVSDTGEGISAVGLPYIFERFRQDDPLASPTRGGLGLGLAIAKQLVGLHGGTIAAASPGKGLGATFTVILPLFAGKGTTRGSLAPAKGAAEERPPSLSGVLVLVVDDEADAREAVRRVLEGADAATIVVGSTDEALDAFRQRRPDVILSDISMPGRDGYDLVRSIRALPLVRGGRVPAIALTAYAAPEERERALSAGFQIHLAKPLVPAKLIAAVAALVSPTHPGSRKKLRGP